MSEFYTRALAASCFDPLSLYDDFDDTDVGLVAALLEIDDRHRRAIAKIAAHKAARRGDRRYSARCRQVEKEITAAAKLKKRDLLMLWYPGISRHELSH